MNPVHYLRLLAEHARYRVRFEVEAGKVLEFVVQLEILKENRWLPVVRYDTSHGFAHRDRYHEDGTKSAHESLPVVGFNDALTFALDDIRENWEGWLKIFEGMR